MENLKTFDATKLSSEWEFRYAILIVNNDPVVICFTYGNSIIMGYDLTTKTLFEAFTEFYKTIK